MEPLEEHSSEPFKESPAMIQDAKDITSHPEQCYSFLNVFMVCVPEEEISYELIFKTSPFLFCPPSFSCPLASFFCVEDKGVQ